jgi:hypothetical protein
MGNKKISLSLFADFGSSEPWKAFLIISTPYIALNDFGSDTLATLGSLSPISFFHLTIGLSSLTSSSFYSS